MFLINCLDLVKKLDEQTRPASLPRAVGAARVSCKVRAYPITLRIDSATRTSSWRTRRASRREPVRGLRVSCQQASNGTVRVHIRAASKRVKLRKVVGPRLVVGAYRSTAASGTAKVRATFTRR